MNCKFKLIRIIFIVFLLTAIMTFCYVVVAENQYGFLEIPNEDGEQQATYILESIQKRADGTTPQNYSQITYINPEKCDTLYIAYYVENGVYKSIAFGLQKTSDKIEATLHNKWGSNGNSGGLSFLANNIIVTETGTWDYSIITYSRYDASTSAIETPSNVYNSYEDAMADINEFIEEYGQSSSELSYSLPPGNIMIIETNSKYTHINMNSVMPLQSTSFADNPWPNTTQRIGYYNNLPSSLNPSVFGNIIDWQRSGNASLFGITTSAAYSPTIVSKFKYIVISNPYYYPANDMDDSQYTNGNINISMDGVINITVKNLTATVNTSTGEVENNENGNEWTGTIDPETGGITWTDQDGEPTTPTSGGNLSNPSINGFQSWLKGILQSIISIFEPAHDAIQTLSGAVGNFANWLYALYIWLPASILSVLKAAITLSIVIGVIKVFI